MKSWMTLSLMLLTCAANAGPVQDAFGPGLFGHQWGATTEEIEAAHPGGRWIHSPVDSYRVEDARPIFGIDRKKQKMTFVFSRDNRLISVFIYFGPLSYVGLYRFMVEQFGEPIPTTSSTLSRWPTDGRFNMTLTQEPFSAVLNIQATAEAVKDRATLGLE